MKNKQKIIAIVLVVLALLIFILVVSNNLNKKTSDNNSSANGVSIENITQKVEQGNVIKASWFNDVSKTLQEQNKKIKSLEEKIAKLEKK